MSDRAHDHGAPPPPERTVPGPDPQVMYRRHHGAHGPSSASLLLIGETGALMVPLTDTDARAHADAPGNALFRFPHVEELSALLADASASPERPMPVHQIATYGGEPVYAASVRGRHHEELSGFEEVGYRELYGSVGDEELGLVSRAIQIIDWDESTQFCSRCGTATSAPEEECVKRCPDCGLTQYPRLAPAMIVGVVRDGKLLLAQAPRFRGRFHSILAGFVEPGETAEECVRREVYEEVGISVRNIRYFGSQPWPYPHSFMLGFTAEYESGELAPDPAEIIHADWYAPDDLPNVPGEVSISGRIINWFRRTYG